MTVTNPRHEPQVGFSRIDFVSDWDTSFPEVGLADEDIDEYTVSVPVHFDGFLQDFADFVLVTAVKLQPLTTIANGNRLVISKLKNNRQFLSVFTSCGVYHCLTMDLLGHIILYDKYNYFLTVCPQSGEDCVISYVR